MKQFFFNNRVWSFVFGVLGAEITERVKYKMPPLVLGKFGLVA
jgi:hypothetical protein